MDKACARWRVIRLDLQILAIRGDRFRLLLRFETLGKATKPVGSLGLNFHGAAEADFRLGRPAGAEVHPAQVLERTDVVGIEMQESLERLTGASAITRAIKRDREQVA